MVKKQQAYSILLAVLRGNSLLQHGLERQTMVAEQGQNYVEGMECDQAVVVEWKGFDLARKGIGPSGVVGEDHHKKQGPDFLV